MEGALFVQQVRTEKQTGNVASAQNGCTRTTLSTQFKSRNNHTRDKFHSHLCFKLYFLVLNISCISLYIIACKIKNLNKSNFFTSIESINQTLKKMLRK